MNENEERIEQFRSEIDGLNLRGSSGESEKRLLALGVVMGVAGLVLAIYGGIQVTNSGGSPTDQRAFMATGTFLGIALVIAGSALFVRYSFARYMRFWFIRMTYESRANTDRVVDAIERAAGGPSGQDGTSVPPSAARSDAPSAS